jgi:hypothetical protein
LLNTAFVSAESNRELADTVDADYREVLTEGRLVGDSGLGIGEHDPQAADPLGLGGAQMCGLVVHLRQMLSGTIVDGN